MQVNRSNRKRKEDMIDDNLIISNKEKKRINRRWQYLKIKYGLPQTKRGGF